MAAELAVPGLHDPMEVDPEEDMRQRLALREEMVRRIREWESLPIYSIFRQNNVIYERMLAVMQADLRLIDNGIMLAKAGKRA